MSICAGAAAAAEPLLLANQDFLFSDAQQLQYEDSYLRKLDPGWRSLGAEFLHWGAYYSINPKLLALLVSEQPGQAANTATIRQIGQKLSEVFYQSYRSQQPTAREAAATRALASFWGDATNSRPAAEFLGRHAEILGLTSPTPSPPTPVSVPSNLLPPADYLMLPFPVGRSWYFGGTHTFTGSDPGPRSSLDFTEGGNWGSDTSSSYVTAAHGGRVVVYSSCFLGVLGDDGWSTTYYHLGPILVSNGVTVNQGDVLANYANTLEQALCSGGHSAGPHVHFSLRKDSAYASLDGVSLSRYRVHDGRYSYDRDCDYFWLERDGIRYCSSFLRNDGLDLPEVSLVGLDLRAGEPADSASFRLYRTGNHQQGLEVKIGVAGTAQPGLDYQVLPATFTIPGGSASLDFELRVLDDLEREPTETIVLTLQASESYQVGAASTQSATLEDDEIPSPPSNLTATATGPQEVALVWTDTALGETGFRIERRVANTEFATLAQTAADTTSYRDLTVGSGTDYVYRVRAENAGGSSSPSNEATVRTPGERAATLLRATPLPQERVEVEWDYSGDSSSSFEIEGRLAALDQPYAVLGQAPAGAKTAVLAALIPDADYLLRVRVRGQQGLSSPSNELEVKTQTAAPRPCVEGTTATCLGGERFEVQVFWRDFQGIRGNGKVVPTAGPAQPAADSGLFYFFSEDNWELLVKVLDGCALNHHHWVFAAATTNVEYTLVVLDRQTGQSSIYGNPLGRVAPTIADVVAFDDCAASTSTAGLTEPARSSALAASVPASAPTSVKAAASGTQGASDLGVATPCLDDADTLCLNGERFRVEVDWRDFVGQTGQGQVVPWGSATSGLFSFFSPENWEILVKVLDGCAINGSYWVFAAGTTTVEYRLRVEDSQRPELTPKSYFNTLGNPATPVIDISAFPCGSI